MKNQNKQRLQIAKLIIAKESINETSIYTCILSLEYSRWWHTQCCAENSTTALVLPLHTDIHQITSEKNLQVSNSIWDKSVLIFNSFGRLQKLEFDLKGPRRVPARQLKMNNPLITSEFAGCRYFMAGLSEYSCRVAGF